MAVLAKLDAAFATSPCRLLIDWVNFDVPAGACDCHTHIFSEPEKFPFFAGPRAVSSAFSPIGRRHFQVSSFTIRTGAIRIRRSGPSSTACWIETIERANSYYCELSIPEVANNSPRCPGLS